MHAVYIHLVPNLMEAPDPWLGKVCMGGHHLGSHIFGHTNSKGGWEMQCSFPERSIDMDA